MMTAETAALALSAQDTRAVLTTASLAPSVHNTQPWRFRLLPDRIELHADLSRALPATDPAARELRLSCGAALFNLRLALQALGIRPLVTLLPGNEAPGAFATIRRGGQTALTDESRALLDAVPVCRTNRQPFLDSPIPTADQQSMVRAAGLERAWLHVVSDRSERARLHELILRAHRLQLDDTGVQAELAGWTGAPDTSSLGESGHLLVVLCSYHEGRLAELQAGQAMQRVLLAATGLGLSTSFLSQPIEVSGTRAELRRAMGGSLVPQAILRIGFGSPVPPTPRRPVDDLLMEPASARY
jgi:nitroreductase